MASGPKFYVYGGGRWRELDINLGRIEGWGRAKFVYAKRGKVDMAKTRSVLTALRDLKAGRQSAVKEGARLPQKTESPQRRAERHSDKKEHNHTRCCHPTNHNGSPSSKTIQHSVAKQTTAAQLVAKTDAAIQTTVPQTLTFPNSLKQKSNKKRKSTSSDDNVPTKIKTTAIVNSSPKKLSKLKLKNKRSLASPDKVSSKKVPSLKLHKEDSTKYNLYRRKRTKSSDSLVWVVLPKTKDNTEDMCKRAYVETKSQQLKNRRISSCMTSEESGPQKIVRRSISVGHNVSQPQNNVKKTKSAPNEINNAQEKLTQNTITSSDDNLIISKPKLNSESIQNVEKAQPSSQDKFKELIIEEEDVEILRNYLFHNATDFDLLEFDQNDEYKRQFFYTINPLVNVQRCPKIARMLRSDSQSEISLKDFASQLGLTSIAKKKVPQRYKMRNRNVETDKSDNETDIENANNIKNRLKNRRDEHTDTETDSDFEEDKRKSKSLNTRSQDRGNVAQTSNSYKRRPAGDRKETDADCSDGDSSVVEEIKTRSLRQRKTDSILKIDLTSDSERYEGPNKRRQNDKMNKTIKGSKINKIDGKTSNDEDSDWTETEVKRTHKRRNTDTDTNDESTEEESTSEDIKRERKKRNSIKDANNQIDSNKENEDVTSKFSNPAKTRNKKGRFVKLKRTIEKKDANDTSDDNSESVLTKHVIKRTRNKNNESTKQTNNQTNQPHEENAGGINKLSKSSLKNKEHSRYPKRNTTIDKKDAIESNDDNSEAEHKSLKLKDSKTQNNKTSNKNLVDSADGNSEEVFKSKEAKSKRQNKLNEPNDHTNIQTKYNNVSQFSDDSGEEFESLKVVKTKKRQINDDKNKNDRNNNMTDTNDENSETEQRKKETKSEQNKQKNNKRNTNVNDSNEKQTGSKPELKANRNVQNKLDNRQNDTTESLNLSSASESDIFAKPVIGEIKSLAVKPREKIERPASSVSLQRVEYSNLEDHAIVSWVSIGGRGRCVNGNRIWRELQDQYQNITGQHRTWHSLRNRYLRSILPRLGQLALSPSLVTRLRAAAATGEIKSRKTSSRRNSIFDAPVLGALSRRPQAAPSPSTDEEPPHKKHKHDHTRKAPSPRVLRSSFHSSPHKAPRSPRYSEITRHFAEKHRESTPNSPNNSSERRSLRKNPLETKNSEKNSLETKKSEKQSLDAKSSSKNLSETKDSSKNVSVTKNSSKNLSQTKKSRRNTPSTKLSSASKESSLRDKSPAQESLKSPETGRTKTRRLFNPSSMIYN